MHGEQEDVFQGPGSCPDVSVLLPVVSRGLGLSWADFFCTGKEDGREGGLLLRAQEVGDYNDTTKEQVGWPEQKIKQQELCG